LKESSNIILGDSVEVDNEAQPIERKNLDKANNFDSESTITTNN
jgi:hypothetical protein